MTGASSEQPVNQTEDEKMNITEISINTKKGETQKLRFLVVQEIPFPDIEGACGSIRWRNFGGLFPQYGSKATGLGSKFYCYLLAPGDVPEDYSRRHFAGYEGNPGTMTFRGKDLGEMTIHFDNNPTWQDIKVRGFDRATGSEREAITELVIPQLKAFIDANKAALREEAIAKCKANFTGRISELRKQIGVLETEAANAVY